MKYTYKCKKCGEIRQSERRADSIAIRTKDRNPDCGGVIFNRVWGFHPDLKNCR